MRRDGRAVDGAGLENQWYRKVPGVRIPLSPPLPFQEVQFYQRTGPVEKYPSGRRGSPAKGVVCESAARVQIPPSPPNKDWNFDTRFQSFSLCSCRIQMQNGFCTRKFAAFQLISVAAMPREISSLKTAQRKCTHFPRWVHNKTIARLSFCSWGLSFCE